MRQLANTQQIDNDVSNIGIRMKILNKEKYKIKWGNWKEISQVLHAGRI